MNKQNIELQQMIEEPQPVGTQIFDLNLPSNLDFDQKNPQDQFNPEHESFNNSKQPTLNLLGDGLKSFKVVGNTLEELPPPIYCEGQLIMDYIPTMKCKCQNQSSSKILKSFWQKIVGFQKREVMIKDGYIYFMEKQGKHMRVSYICKIRSIFKIFVDEEEEKVRLVISQREILINKDIKPDNFTQFLNILSQNISKIGLNLKV